MYNTYFKRLIDFSIALLSLILLSWLFVIIMIIIKLTSEGSVFFLQKRVGKNKKYFYIIKFRTMRIDTPQDAPTHLLENPQQYITPIGKILRFTSLDELPQLINILKNDMSLVGPRPALWNQYDLIEARDQYGANNIRPGLTGWAQVNGRDELPITVKAKFDGEYTEKMGLLFDLKCISKTFGCVLFREGMKEGAQDT